MENGRAITEHDHYSNSLSEDGIAMLLSWNRSPGLSAQAFADGIIDFATQCVAHHPSRAVIDARQLDPDSEGVAWLRGKSEVDGLAAYEPWWAETIVPLYHDAGISSLAVATGDPNAPGEVSTAPEIKFLMGYFDDVEAASTWPTG